MLHESVTELGDFLTCVKKGQISQQFETTFGGVGVAQDSLIDYELRYKQFEILPACFPPYPSCLLVPGHYKITAKPSGQIARDCRLKIHSWFCSGHQLC